MRILALVLLVALGLPARAAGVDLLRGFIAEVKGMKAEFSQLTVDGSGRTVQQATGSFQFQRPGRFRWTTVRPYDQLVVGDGRKVWLYDRELNQVTVKAMDDALGSSPAALLAGSNELDRAYGFAQLPRKDGLEWIEATPTDPDSSFERMRIGFRKANPEVMELLDRLGQTTTIRFTRLERNPKLSPDTFRFTPPPGADVVGDP